MTLNSLYKLILSMRHHSRVRKGPKGTLDLGCLEIASRAGDPLTPTMIFLALAWLVTRQSTP